MRKIYPASLFVLIILLVLTSCSTAKQPGQVVEDYFNAIVTKDVARLSILTCAEWTPDAIFEMDSFQAVSLTLQDLSCYSAGEDGSYLLVSCRGFLVTSYNGEQQQIDLSLRTYQVVAQGNDFLVCGYR